MSDTFVLVTSRFNLPYVRDFLRHRAERHQLGLWTETASPGLMTRELNVTLHGALAAIGETRRAVGLEA